MVALIRQIIKLEDGTELAPNNNVRIQAMDWQVAEDETFRNIVLRSENDTRNLSSIVFTDILDPNTKWHARARALIKDSGWTVWGNLDVLNYQQSEEVINSETIPSRISAPVITTSSNPDNHEATLFSIFANGFDVVGNSVHESTSWFIEDINGRLIWSDVKDTINKKKVDFKNMVLRNNTIYRIRAMFHSSSGDSSTISCYTVRVGSNNALELVTYLDNVDYRKDFEVVAVATDMDQPVDSITWQIISMANTNAEIIFNKTTTGAEYGKMTIPANLLKDDTVYVLKLKPNVENGAWKYIQFKTMNIEAYHTNLIVTPTETELKVGQSTTIEVIASTDNIEFSYGTVGIIEYNPETKTITALKSGSGSLSITAQEPDKYPATVNIYVKVNEKDPEFVIESNPVEIIGREIIPVRYTTNGRLQLVPHEGIDAVLEEKINQIVFSARNNGTIKVQNTFGGKTETTDIIVNYTDPNLVGKKLKVTGTITLGTALPDSWINGTQDLVISNRVISRFLNPTNKTFSMDGMISSVKNNKQQFKGEFTLKTITTVNGVNGTLTKDYGILIDSDKFKNNSGGSSTAIGAKQDIEFIISSYSYILKTMNLKIEATDDTIVRKYNHVSTLKASAIIENKDIEELRRTGVNETTTTAYYVLDSNTTERTKPFPVKLTVENIDYSKYNNNANEFDNTSGAITMSSNNNITIANAKFSIFSAREVTEKIQDLK